MFWTRILLFLILTLTTAPLRAQVATTPLDPSRAAISPAATAWRHLNDSGEPQDSTSLGARLLQQGGTAGDDFIDWSASSEELWASFALGLVRIEPRGEQQAGDLTWIKAGSHCGQLAGIYNCSYQTAGQQSHQSARTSAWDASLYWGPVAVGTGWSHRMSQIESEDPLQENTQSVGLSWQAAGPLYLGGALDEVTRKRSNQTLNFSRQWTALGVRTGVFRLEYAQASAPYAQTGYDLQLMHPQETQQVIQLELKLGRMGLGLYQTKVEFAAIEPEYQVERGTELREVALSWVPEAGYLLAYRYRDEIYRMAIGTDETQEGTAQGLSLGLVF